MPFLPTTQAELNFNQPDFILVSVDAYVDHPSFGHAIVSRLVEYLGFSIAIIPQPISDTEYTALGTPKYGFLVSGGVVDSMVNNYTVAKIKRTTDSYSEGGRVGRTPDRALTVHTKNLRRLFPSSPIMIGGIEASLRRFAHYDYWNNAVMPSLLVDAPADLLLYGMGEYTIKAVLELVKKGVPIKKIKDIAGTAYLDKPINLSKKLQKQIESGEVVTLPSFGEVCSDKKKYVEAFNMQYKNSEHTCKKILIQKHGKLMLVVNPPQPPLDTNTLDLTYTLPYMREYHPMYKDGVPSLTEVKFSLTATRGCFGACNYCAITMHQGRMISKRSKDSLLAEATALTTKADFKGYIHDVGGPTANFRNPPCAKQAKAGCCDNKTCIGHNPCKNLIADHSEYMDILRAMRNLDGIKKVFVRSGIRYDYLMMDKNVKSILKELVEHHISGQLKVAPEHCVDAVLKAMNKTPFKVYKEFSKLYREVNKERGKEQYLVPYLISSHPACTTDDAIELALFLKSINYMPQQVQDFYPTPATKSTTMYYTGINPDTMKPIYVPRSVEEKRTQRALMQYGNPKNYSLVKNALIKSKRLYLMGNAPSCLIKNHINVKANGRK